MRPNFTTFKPKKSPTRIVSFFLGGGFVPKEVKPQKQKHQNKHGNSNPSSCSPEPIVIHGNPPAPVGAKGRAFPEALATGSFS